MDSTHFADIDVGHEVTPLRLTLTGEQVKRYAITARMPGGRFMSDEEARHEGLPGQIVPGQHEPGVVLAAVERGVSGHESCGG